MVSESELAALVLACRTDDKQAKASALEKVVQAHLDRQQPQEAIACATEALELSKSTGDKSREAAALLLSGPAYMQVGDHIPALKVAKEAVAIYAQLGDKAKEAEAAIGLARLHCDATKLGDMKAAEASSSALKLAKGTGDKKLEGNASIEVARAQLLQVKDLSAALTAAEEAVGCLKGLDDKRCEAASLEVLAKVHLAKMDSEPALKAATDAYALYKSMKDARGMKSSWTTLEKVKASRYEITPAKLMVEDKTAIAIIEMSATSSQESLMMIIDTLKSIAVKGWNGLKAICLMVEGKEVPKQVVPPLISTGAFCVGLKSIGLPLIGCTWGIVSGDIWQVLLAMDYRVTSVETIFNLPMVGSPSVLAKLIGSQYVAELMMTRDVLLAQHLQEMGLFQASLGNADEARKMVLEFARRVAGMPALACRQTITLLNPDPMEFFIGKEEVVDEQ
mmetsp:Transcript_7742/g.16997  ORF Transcript_7742/g.16997 Transcript_7742/m.16997 type:complete len:450 (+) Transcript_7742:124-1473(+)|eukprot:CAMPEP_0178387094 /NCGR_PEP_ID=MMETSP0689_2-20121128/8898_1 /TAXON_ID=160604 /ORGANISM="Amphidinium massartii, Strain CS-259" /LENGTH=449 /DNA_ID=CAMNT_0020007451 /DNA_START=38 /DNA_END=1387 /DNA_ORIENTATION=-